MFGHFLLKRFDLGPIWTGENGFANIFVFSKILTQSSKIACPRSHANFSLDTEVFIFLNCCYWVCKHIYVIVPLKSVRRLQSFLKVSKRSWSCLRSCWLRRHRVQHDVRVVVDLRSHRVGRCCWLRWHHVSVVNDYAVTRFSRISSVFRCIFFYKICRKSRDTFPLTTIFLFLHYRETVRAKSGHKNKENLNKYHRNTLKYENCFPIGHFLKRQWDRRQLFGLKTV